MSTESRRVWGARACITFIYYFACSWRWGEELFRGRQYEEEVYSQGRLLERNVAVAEALSVVAGPGGSLYHEKWR